MLRLIKETNFNFTAKRRITFIISGILSLLGIIALISITLGFANLGVDFKGGLLLRLKIIEGKLPTTEYMRHVLQKNNIVAELQPMPAYKELLIRIGGKDLPAYEVMRKKILNILKKNLPECKFDISIDYVGPKIGRELREKATLAIFIAVVVIMLYIALRFKPQFGVIAAITTFHDVLATLGIFWLLGKEINLLLITALLTLAGYSLTDTVVIFDRIRDNMKLQRKEGLEWVINRSINEVLSRTIITTLTTAFVLLALIIYGSSATLDFAIAFLFGIIIGTYSSIFIAAPLLLEWHNYLEKKSKIIKPR